MDTIVNGTIASNMLWDTVEIHSEMVGVNIELDTEILDYPLVDVPIDVLTEFYADLEKNIRYS